VLLVPNYLGNGEMVRCDAVFLQFDDAGASKLEVWTRCQLLRRKLRTKKIRRIRTRPIASLEWALVESPAHPGPAWLGTRPGSEIKSHEIRSGLTSTVHSGM
jgi:hypothetical protein